jgi:hypothetical protein
VQTLLEKLEKLKEHLSTGRYPEAYAIAIQEAIDKIKQLKD